MKELEIDLKNYKADGTVFYRKAVRKKVKALWKLCTGKLLKKQGLKFRLVQKKNTFI